MRTFRVSSLDVTIKYLVCVPDEACRLGRDEVGDAGDGVGRPGVLDGAGGDES